LGLLVFPAIMIWMTWTTLNEWDPAWLIWVVVSILACFFLFIGGILFAVGSWATPAGLDIVAAIIIGAGIFFLFRAKNATPQVHGASTGGGDTGEYQEW
jgi:hypothetical protein